MQVAGLAVVERVGATRSRGVVARRLVGKRGKGKAVWVEQRGRKSPGLIVAARSGVLVLDVLMAVGLAVEGMES